MEKRETFYTYEEALACRAQHIGAEITHKEGHPVLISGEMVYVIPEDRPSWTVRWNENIIPGNDNIMVPMPGTSAPDWGEKHWGQQ